MSDPGSTVYANYALLYAKAQQALANNIAYLAIPAPSQAQAVAQVQTLTRQVDAVIRTLLGMLDVTDGT